MIFVRFLLITVAVGLLFSGPVRAAEVSVRTGSHEEYSRLVFDWGNRVEYSVERPEKNKLVVTFKENASLNTSKAIANPVANVSAIDVLSEEPLKVSITIPSQSRTRDLRAGTRVVVDIYNPPGGAKKKEPLKVSEAPKPAPAEKQPEKPAAEEPPVEEAKEQPPSQKELETVMLEMGEEPTVVTVSAVEGFGLAAFELADRLWLVHDKPDILTRPQISGPGKVKLTPLGEVDVEGGKAHTLPVLGSQDIRGFGGAVLWRVLFAAKFEKEKTPVYPVRSGVERAEARSGKVLWPLETAHKVLDVTDPLTGMSVKVVTVDDAEDFAGVGREFVDFTVLPSSIGLAIVPKVSDLEVSVVRGGVEISRPEGLSIVDGALVDSMKVSPELKTDGEQGVVVSGRRIFDFNGWKLGGIESALENKNIILSQLNMQSGPAKIEDLLILAKMYAANAMGPESLGALHFAEVLQPGLLESPEYLALHGVASALAKRNEDAFRDLSVESLEPFEEVNFWRAAVLADVGDWQQAASLMPSDLSVLYDYPALILNRLVPQLAEVTLRKGDLQTSEQLLSMAEANASTMNENQKAALQYLKGESARQSDAVDETKELWEPLTTGHDDLYRAKAGLALTRLLVEKGEIDSEEAIDNLERLRYAWRGDLLEVQINYWLGVTYFENKEYVKGLKIMREAASYDPGTELGRRVAQEMADVFTDLYLSDKLDNVSALDAVSVYDQFQELVPLDERGNFLVQRLAERVAKADLLTRAGDLLEHQVVHRLKQPSEIYRVGTRLAAIRLLDKDPKKAMMALDKAAAALEQLPEEMKTPQNYRAISLLRARALSQEDRPDQALALLNDINATPDTNRLRADIAWTAGYWDDAAEALGDVILDQNISLTRPLDGDNTSLILQRAIALNLSNDRIALANMREKFSDAMNQTNKAKIFEVITRPRQSGALADRETLLSVVSEVDLFSDFLESYKETQTPSN